MQCSKDWQMDFSEDKCYVMHFDDKDIKHEHEMLGKPFLEAEGEREKKKNGVIISNDVKYTKQLLAAYE